MSVIKVDSIEIKRDCVHVVFLGLPNVPGIAAGVFKTLATAGVGVDMVTQNTMRGGRSDLSFLIQQNRLDQVIPLCCQISDNVGGQGVSFATEIAVLSVSIDKADAAAMSQVLSEMFSTLAGAGVNIEIINSTLASVMCIVSMTRADEGLKALKEAFGV